MALVQNERVASLLERLKLGEVATVYQGCQGSGRFPRSMVGYMSPPFSSDVLCCHTSFSPVIEP